MVKNQTVRALLIVVGVCVLVVIVGLGAALWLFTQSFDFSQTDEASATQRLSEVRGRFAGVKPLLDIRDGEPVLTRPRPASVASGARLTTLHVIAWDPEDKEFARVDLPFWLLRLKSGAIELGDSVFDEDLNITVEDLERYGPTLVLDHVGRDGEHVLVWTD